MAITLRIPPQLRTLTDGQDEIPVEGATVAAAIDALEAKAPGIKARIINDQGKVQRSVNLFLGEDDIRTLEGLETALKDGDELSVIPAIAGGC